MTHHATTSLLAVLAFVVACDASSPETAADTTGGVADTADLADDGGAETGPVPDAAPDLDAIHQAPDGGPPPDAADGGPGGAREGADAGAADAEPADAADTAAPSTDTTNPEPSPPTSIGGDRPAVVYAPSDYDPSKAWPLVILLHGYSANGFVQNIYLGLSGRTTQDGFILVVPDGTKDAQGNLFWNATDYCCDFYGVGVDDVSYVLSLIDEASAGYSIDAKRVYLVGHSNGGFMSYRMACEAPDRITALVSIAGATFKSESKCEGTGAVSVLQVHGTEDETIAFGGGLVYPGAEETVGRWVTKDGCDPSGIAGDPLDIDDQVGGAETQVTRWQGCDAGTSVELWAMQGSTHIPGFSTAFAEKAMAFLLAHSRE